MQLEINELKAVLDEVRIDPKDNSNNIFNIGTRGFYENPFTEILAFLINSNSNYPHRELFVKQFLNSIPGLNKEAKESLQLNLQVETQFTTTQLNYIDLIIYNTDIILVFENKIYHKAINPFEEYRSDITLRFSKQKAYFYLFSFNSLSAPEHWQNIEIPEIFERIQKNLVYEINDKWKFYIDDFLMHYIKTKRKLMDRTEYSFYAENFNKIILANENLKTFLNQTISKVITNSNFDPRTKLENWGNDSSRAIRFFPENNEDNVVLVFNISGKFGISIYYYKDYLTNLSDLKSIVGEDYKDWREGNVTCFALLDEKEFEDIHSAINECTKQLIRMKKYYS